MLSDTATNRQEAPLDEGKKRRRAARSEDSEPCRGFTPGSQGSVPPSRKSVGFSERPLVRTFTVCGEDASSRREHSRYIKRAVKRARFGTPSSELAPFRARIKELVARADAHVYTLKALREDLETETGIDLSVPALKRELKVEMQRVLGELSGGTLVAAD